jgi:tetratricopeptide (TPR) repeat protein
VGSKTLLAASYAARGKLRSAKGDYEAALADLDEAITREPELPYAHLYRGLTYLAVNRCQEGLQELYSIGGKDNPAIATALLDYSDAIAKTDCPDHML